VLTVVYFVRSPEHGVVQMLVLVVAWGHAMIGLHFWQMVRPWYARLQPAALVVAVLIPALSLLGAIEAGRQVTAIAADPNWIHERITLPSRRPRASSRPSPNYSLCFLPVWLAGGPKGRTH
jgi:hypothetical protein